MLFALKLALIAWLVYSSLRGRSKYGSLAAAIARDGEKAQERYLNRGALRKLLLTPVAVVLMLVSKDPLPFELPHASLENTASYCAGVLAMIAVSVVVFRYIGDRQLRFLIRSVGAILPRTPRARRRFIVVSAVAGLTEEIIFRWFLTDFFLFPGFDFSMALIASSVIFGLAHYYQGPLNVVLTGVAGYIFGMVWVDSGSLWVSIFMHFLIDARLALVLTDARWAELEGRPLVQPAT